MKFEKPIILKFDNQCNNNCKFCKDMEIISYKPIIPKRISIEFSKKCNLKCLHCDLWKKKEDELSTKDIKEIIDALSNKFGTNKITFSGKEPFLREDLFEILEFCLKKDIIITLNTNGSLINENIKKKISKFKNNLMINISLDGTKKTHDKIRNKKGTYQKVINSINILKDLNIKTSIISTILKSNINELEPLAQFAKDKKIPIIFQLYLQNLGQKQNIEWYKYSKEWPGKIDNILDKIMLLKNNGFPIRNSIEHINLLKKYYKDPSKKILNNCNASKESLIIKSDKSIGNCFEKKIDLKLKNNKNIDWFDDEFKKSYDMSKTCILNCNLLNCYYLERSEDNIMNIKRSILNLKKKSNKLKFLCNFEMNNNFFKIIKFAKEQGFKISLLTNGRMFSYKEYAKKVIKFIDEFEVILLGDEKTHNKITNTESYNQTIKGIKNLQELGADIKIINDLEDINKSDKIKFIK